MMPAHLRLTWVQACNAATLHKFGWKLEAIAAHYGAHVRTIRRELRMMGVYQGHLQRRDRAEAA